MILTYSQSTDPRRPHYKDMTELYSQKGWVDIRYQEADILADPNLETLHLVPEPADLRLFWALSAVLLAVLTRTRRRAGALVAAPAVVVMAMVVMVRRRATRHGHGHREAPGDLHGDPGHPDQAKVSTHEESSPARRAPIRRVGAASAHAGRATGRFLQPSASGPYARLRQPARPSRPEITSRFVLGSGSSRRESR